MNSLITTYEKLLERKKKLEELVASQELLIRIEYMELKEEFEPVGKTINTVSEFLIRDKKSWLLNEGLSLMIDKLVKDILLSNSGWVTKTIIPELIKNYSSHYIVMLQEILLKEINKWIDTEQDSENEPAMFTGNGSLN